jgi:predicted anti-sigma-YlaC factor YlaD
MMKCPEFETLFAYVDQTLGPKETQELVEHLQSCPACRETLTTIETLRYSRLMGSNRQSRWTPECLNEQQLSAYLDHALEPKEKIRVEEHFAGCDFCLGELAVLARIRSSLEESMEQTPEWLLDRAKNLAGSPVKLPWEKRPSYNWIWQVLVPSFALLLIFVTYKLWPRRQIPLGKVTPNTVTQSPVKPVDTITQQVQPEPRRYKVIGKTEVGMNILSQQDTLLTNELAKALTNYQPGKHDEIKIILTQLGLRLPQGEIKQVLVSETLLVEISQGRRQNPIRLVLLDDGTLAITRLNKDDALKRL